MVYPALIPLMRTPRLPVVEWNYAPRFKWTRPPKDEFWFLRVCHHISNTVYILYCHSLFTTWRFILYSVQPVVPRWNKTRSETTHTQILVRTLSHYFRVRDVNYLCNNAEWWLREMWVLCIYFTFVIKYWETLLEKGVKTGSVLW